MRNTKWSASLRVGSEAGHLAIAHSETSDLLASNLPNGRSDENYPLELHMLIDRACGRLGLSW
jgi:hypothetical protein